jgi:hypothetical protein
MLLDNGRMKVREIADTIGISKERVGYILHRELDMKKLCAKWVPRLLTYLLTYSMVQSPS